MQRVKAFFEAIDVKWSGAEGPTIELHLIGSTALMVLTDYDRGTKDSDVLETATISGSTRDRLIKLAGPDTAVHKRHRMYLDIVQSAIPFLPHAPLFHEHAELNTNLRHFRVAVLDVVDVVVSKLNRFSRSDQDDINEMIRRGKVPHSTLIERFHAVVDRFAYDGRDYKLPACVANLHRIEREVFGVSETQIELPSWIDD